MSYRLSYPLYLDVSEHKQNQFNSANKINSYQREGNPSPTTALINLNAFYETMIANTQSAHNIQNSALFANKSQVSSLSSLGIANNMYYSSHMNSDPKLSANNPSKSSFSIEAILGLRNRQNNYLIVNDDNPYDFDQNKYRTDYRLSNQISPKASDYQKEKSLASVSPDSTAKEHLLRYNQRPKTKNLSTNLVRLQTNNNKRSIECVESTETKTDSAEMDLSQRLAHNSIPQSKSKRVRTIFTPEQLEKLEGEFERQQYMVGPERLYLASALNLSEAQVKVWFQNRRIKWRKQHLEMEHATLKKSNHTIDSANAEHEMPSNQEQFKSFKSVDSGNDFLCQTPHSVDVLH